MHFDKKVYRKRIFSTVYLPYYCIYLYSHKDKRELMHLLESMLHVYDDISHNVASQHFTQSSSAPPVRP